MLRLEPEKVPYSLKDFGNTSGSSVPLTMIVSLREEMQKRKLNLLLSAFGVGLSWGSVLLETDRVCIPELMEL
jgi:3-oxoacyl-[acyl-carrier-protein] synthase-3